MPLFLFSTHGRHCKLNTESFPLALDEGSKCIFLYGISGKAIVDNLELAQLVKSICHPWPRARSDLAIGDGHTDVNEIVPPL